MGERCEEWFKPVSLTFHSDYCKAMAEPALFAVVFGYIDPLFELIFECSLQSDIPTVGILYLSQPLFIEMQRGKLNVRNYAEEGEETETLGCPSDTYQ